MTNEKSYVNMMATNPVLTVAPAASRRRKSVIVSDKTCQVSTRQPGLPVNTPAQMKEKTEMFGATDKKTALYCRLSQEDERAGKSLSIENQDRGILWNAVEETEKTKDSRLAREFVVALPIELNESQWEKLRANIIVFRYQLRHISRGKYKLGQYLNSATPTLAEYLALVQKMKNAVKERKSLLAEKKEISFWNIPKAKELNATIAELTEDIEELKSEKAVLLNHLDCADDAGMAAIKKDIASAEAGLSKLEQQEEKYSFELEAALSEYAVLKEQSAGFDSTELYAQRMELRSVKTADASHRIQSAYGEKYDPLVMFDSKRDVTELLHEENESRAYKQRLKQQKQQEQLPKQREKRNHERQER